MKAHLRRMRLASFTELIAEKSVSTVLGRFAGTPRSVIDK
jgi:hypothetical protein